MAEQHHRVPARRPYHSPARQRQAEQTRAGILAAARDLFRSAGYAATTIDAIASSAQGWLARNLPQRKGLTRSLSSMLAARPSIRARRVQLACRLR
jgi:hypothetical protein